MRRPLRHAMLNAALVMLSFGFGCGDDSSVVPDAGLDAGSDASADAGSDAGADTGADGGMDSGPRDAETDVPVDGGTPDTELPERRELYAIIGLNLVTVDTATGAAASVATLASDVLLAFDPASRVLHAMTGGTSSPGLVQIDPCSGVFSGPLAITVAGETVFFAEGMAWDPVGERLYVSASLDGPIGSDSRSETLLSVDPETGVGSILAVISGTIDDEADALDVVAGELFAYDAFTPSCAGSDGRRCTEVHTLDTTSGVATKLGDITYHVNFGVHDTVSDAIFAWHVLDTPEDNNLLSFDRSGGGTTPVGPTHTPADFGDGDLSSMTFVTHRCPE